MDEPSGPPGIQNFGLHSNHHFRKYYVYTMFTMFYIAKQLFQSTIDM